MRRKIWLELDGGFVIGEGGFDLLDAVRKEGSLTAAARTVGWSYRHAWGYLRRVERTIGERLTNGRPGKGRRRGIVLTSSGEEMLKFGRSLGWQARKPDA